MTTRFELADVPGRLAYSFQFTNGFIASDHTSMSNGRATEQVSVTSGITITKNLRNGASVQTE